MSGDVNGTIAAEQADYYRARAGEYDRWFFRQGRYDRGEAATRAWFHEVEVVRQALAAMPLADAEVLELASGTGLWTELLCRRAASVVAVDASAEMIQECRLRLGSLSVKVSFVIDDLFAWEPSGQFDAVVFCFWISHVPIDRLDAFLAKVARSLRPGGFVFFVDARKEHSSTATDHVLPREGDELMVRRLDDGREFTIVKNFWLGEVLERRFAAVGFDIRVNKTATYFQYGVGQRRG